MSSDTFYVRVRGRVKGPYTRAEVEARLKRKTLSRIHEISLDRENWDTIANHPELSDMWPGAEPSDGAIGMDPLPISEEESGSDAGISAEEQYYYSRGGNVTGPVSLKVLRSLASKGKLRSGDLVQKSDQVWLHAHTIEELSKFLTKDAARGRTSTGTARFDTTPEPSPADDNLATRIIGWAGNLSLSGGFSAAVVLLFCLNVPHARTANRLHWWWDLLGQPGTALLVVLCFYILLVGAGLLVVAPILKGRPRGWVYLGISGPGFLLSLAAAMFVVPSYSLLIFTLISPVFGAGTICLSYFRSLAPESPRVRLIQVIAAASFALVTVGALAMGEYGLFRLRPANDFTPAWIIAAMLLSLVGHLCGITGGVLGGMGMKPERFKRFKTAIIALSIIATIAPMVTGLVVAGGISSLPGADALGGRFVLVHVSRLLVTTYTFVSLAMIGLSELLICSSFAPPALGRDGTS